MLTRVVTLRHRDSIHAAVAPDCHKTLDADQPARALT
jgi:hypothetical protein